MVRSAAASAGKHLWLSEVQGGRSATGFNLYDPVDAASQQRWIWNGIASGADTILFWCWRNEIFGRESGGFGLAGDDGLAQERLDAMRQTHAAIKEHSDLLADYQMNEGKVGVLFSPQSYYLHWSQEETADKAKQSLLGYCRALVRKSIPYRVIEEEHLEELSEIKVLFLPRMLVATPRIEAALSAFVEGGGTLVCESECGAFDPIGIYRYPEQRFTAKLTGMKEIGRRNLIEQHVEVSYGGQKFPLHLTQWLTPWENTRGEVLCTHSEGAIISRVRVKAGKVILVGSYLGEAYFQDWYAGFEDFIAAICEANGCGAEVWATGETVKSDSFVYIKSGESQGKKMVFVFYPKEADTVELRFAPGFLRASNMVDCVGGNVYPVNDGLVIVNSPAQRVSVLVESEG
jgi:beta-galactosidase